jgi:hypothetical protein
MSRWLLAGTSTGLVAGGALVLASTAAPSATAATSPGVGSSYAQSLQVAPHDGSLAVGLTLGESLAGHTGSYSRAQSQGVDLGAIGTSLTTYNCGSVFLQPNQIPQPFEVEAGSRQAASGQTQSATSGGYGSDEYVVAKTTPYAEADTTFAGQLNDAVINASGMASKAWSGMVNGQRIAGAESDIGSISLLNGMVKLAGLHWEATYPSGGSSAQPSGTFSLGSLVVGGVSIPTNLSTSTLDKAINQVLNAVGLQLQLPTAKVSPPTATAPGIEAVSPLELDVVPNTARDTLLGNVLGALNPVLNPVKTGLESGFGSWEPAQLAQQLCQTDTPFTVADIALASFTGAGYFSSSFGGVNASSGNLVQGNFTLGFHPGPLTVPGSFHVVGGLPGTSGSTGSGSLGTPGTPGTPGSPAVPASPGSSISTSGSGSTPLSSGGGAPTATSPSSTSSGPGPTQTTVPIGYAAGGPLLAVGLGGLGLLALLVEGDRRMMRRAQHTVSFEE